MEDSQKIYAIWVMVDHEETGFRRYARGLSAARRIAAEEVAGLSRYDSAIGSYKPMEFYVVIRELKIEGDE